VESVIRLVTSIQGVLQVIALIAALFALYELAVEPDWRRRLAATAARILVVFLCGTVGVAGLLLGQNAVLLLADRLSLSLGLVQLGFLVCLLLAVVGWARE
jgi:hypothetical protein